MPGHQTARSRRRCGRPFRPGPPPDTQPARMTVSVPTDARVTNSPGVSPADMRDTLGRLIRLATGSECSRSLVDAAWQDLRRPLGVVDATGAIVASAPIYGHSNAALQIARTVAAGLADPPRGWIARRLQGENRTVGWLVIQRPDVISADEEALVEALSGLLAAQLGRAVLRRSVVAERQAAIHTRVATEPGANIPALLAEAEGLGVHLASAYWPSLIVWRRGELTPTALDAATQVWRSAAASLSFLAVCDGALALLYADTRPGTLLQSDVEAATGQIVAILSRGRPALEPHGVVGECSVPIERLHRHVHNLRRLKPYAERATASPQVLSVRHFALDRLLENVSPARAQSFVNQCVGALLAYDERHGTSLASTLELALENPRRDEAARAAFMHRNTFRRRLQQALELIGADLDDPDQRLALHVALKLHRHLAIAATARGTRYESPERHSQSANTVRRGRGLPTVSAPQLIVRESGAFGGP